MSMWSDSLQNNRKMLSSHARLPPRYMQQRTCNLQTSIVEAVTSIPFANIKK
jgi:hypothetical protein